MVYALSDFLAFSIYESMINCLGCSSDHGDRICMPDLPISIACPFDRALSLPMLIEGIVTRSL